MNRLLTKTLLGTFFLLMATASLAQSVKTNFDEKVINTDSLNMPKSTLMTEVLTILPELLQRPGEFYLSNYDIQIEGMSVGSASDVALSQLQIADVKEITVSESPVTSYKNNGQGGSIDITLRSSGVDDDPLWGGVGVAGGYPTDVAPQFNIGYKNSNYMIRGLLLGEVYNNSSETKKSLFEGDELMNSSTRTTDIRFRTQLARAYMEFTPTQRDKVKLNVSEIYTYTKEQKTPEESASQASVLRKRATDLHLQTKYEHEFNRSKLKVEAQYIYNPGKNDYDEPLLCVYNNDFRSHNVLGKAEFKTALLSPAKAKQPKPASLDLTFGSNFNAFFNTETMGIKDLRYTLPLYTEISPDNKTYYAMPYLKLEGGCGKLKAKVIGEFQHYKYRIMRADVPFTKVSNDFTGQLITEWHFTPHKNLRLILDRKLQRPTDEQLYPYRIYSPRRMEYVEGNPDLIPMMSHEAKLDYIADYRWGLSRSLTFNAAASYNRVSDILSDRYSTSSPIPGSMGLAQQYLTFENFGTNNIASANLMALYSYKVFSLSLTGNLFHNVKDMSSGRDHYTYYNISFYPHFQLKDGWHGGVYLVYYSKVAQHNSTLGNCATAQMSVGKSWRNLYVYVYERVLMQKHAEDVNRTSSSEYSVTSYDMIPNVVGIGCKYSF